MGMFDYLRCERELPAPNAADLEFQTKDLDCDLDNLVIRADGTLWREAYDTEDRSDPNAEGLLRLCGIATRVNKRWEQLADFFGEVNFYKFTREDGWLEFRARFVDGKLHGPIVLVEDTRSSDDGLVQTASEPKENGNG